MLAELGSLRILVELGSLRMLVELGSLRMLAELSSTAYGLGRCAGTETLRVGRRLVIVRWPRRRSLVGMQLVLGGNTNDKDGHTVGRAGPRHGVL